MNDRALHRRIVAALVLLTLAVFSPVLRNGFVRFDDAHFITQNPNVLRGVTLHGLTWAMTSTENSNWIPLTRISHMVNVQLFGLRAAGHHAVSLLVHAATAGLLFVALTRLTGAAWPAAFAAAVFAIHPLRVESVAWAAEFKDVLCGFFFALALLFHQRYAARRLRRDYLLVIAAAVLGLMAKPMLVTLPLILLLLDLWPLHRFRHESPAALIREKIPLFVLAAAAGLVATHTQSLTGAVGSFADYPLAVRLSNSVVSCAAYLGKLLWPTRLSFFYPFAGAQLAPLAVAAAALLLIAVTATVLLRFRTRPWLATGWFWFLVMLAPVSGIVQVGFQAMADRYTYLPLIGIGCLISWEVAARCPAGRGRVVCAAAAGAVLLGFAVLTPLQVARWHDSRTLFLHALALEPGNWLAELKLGEIAREENNPAEALPHLERAVAGAPWNFYARTVLGVTYGELGRNDDALRELEETIRISPGWADGRHNLAVALANTGRSDEALQQLRVELRLEPRSVRARSVLAPLLFSLGELDGAETVAREWLALAPGAVQARDLLDRIRAARSPR